MARIKCFLVAPTRRERRWFRIFDNDNNRRCTSEVGRFGYHHALIWIGDEDAKFRSIRDGEDEVHVGDWGDPTAFPRSSWPEKCGFCDFVFEESATRQCFSRLLYEREDTKEQMPLDEFPAGAAWYATWLERAGYAPGPDGRCLMVRTPGGDWFVDGCASNCTFEPKDPLQKLHHCWVRSGRVPDAVTVGKSGGPTCSAGGGSILARSYHGFLRDGHLVDGADA